MAIEKPASIAASPFKSAKWDELTEGRDFKPSDIPTLELLCQWHAIAARCMEDMDVGGEVQVAYSNAMDDIKALPQIATMKQASAEIRALNKQLGIVDGRDAEPERPKKETRLYVIQANRANRRAGAQGRARTG